VTFTLSDNDALIGALCIECGQPFRVGQRVQHVSGSTTRHVECPDEYEQSQPF
jgi:hypothetical protein